MENFKELIGKKVIDGEKIQYEIIDVDLGSEGLLEDITFSVKANDKVKEYGLLAIYQNGRLIFDEETNALIKNALELKEKKDKEEIEFSLNKTKKKKFHLNDNCINGFKEKYSFLSNMYKCKVMYKDLSYLSSEAAFQAQKEPSRRYEFIKINGFEAKRLGKQVNLREDWDKVKIDIMKEIVYCKFSQNLDLKRKLLATGNKTLVEGNSWGDTFWGVSMKDGPSYGTGENNLGLILMEVRERLFNELKLINNNETFSQRVIKFLKGKNGVLVDGTSGKSSYLVKLSENEKEVELLDKESLQPIPLFIFDEVEKAIDEGIRTRGNARLSLGSNGFDKNTIMGWIAYNYYHKEDGDSMFDSNCYIFAILSAADCVVCYKGDLYKL